MIHNEYNKSCFKVKASNNIQITKSITPDLLYLKGNIYI